MRRIGQRLALIWVLFLTAFASAQAYEESGFREPRQYVGGGAFVFNPDKQREIDGGWGTRANAGYRSSSGLWFELTGFGLKGDRTYADGQDSALGLGGDMLLPLASDGIKPFALVGGGYYAQKINGSSEGSGYVDAGLGLLFPLTSGLDLRTEARYVAVLNDAGAAEPGSDPLYDLQFGLALQATIGSPVAIDADGDGLVDPYDLCPGTSANVAIDERGCPSDIDRDRVADYLDRCPATPAGTPVDTAGCPFDSDGDGVSDSFDRCPDTAAGLAVDRAGCATDADGDGIADMLDRCPATPAGVSVDTYGCVVEKRATTFELIHFTYAQSKLTKEAKALLVAAAESIQNDPKMRVEIAGYNDPVETADAEADLSLKRANAVRSFLVEQGVAQGRLTIRGYGTASPIASNKTEQGRAQNRRVEIRVLKR